MDHFDYLQEIIMPNFSQWDNIVSGNYDLAIANLIEYMDNHPGRAFLGNLFVCYMMKNDPETALKTALEIISLNPKSASGYINAGTACWWMGKMDEAIRFWEDSLPCTYTDAAGGFTSRALLLFGGIRTNNPKLVFKAEKLLVKKTLSRRNSAWPGPIALYLLGTRDEIDMINYLKDRPNKPKYCWVQLYFWFGVNHLRKGDLDKYYEYLEKATTHKLPIEYLLANYELKNRLDSVNPL